MQQIKIASLSDIDVAAKEFLAKVGDKRVFAFYGNMGAGKTTFIKSICSLLGVVEEVNSPTFAIINEYKGTGDEPIYHFDFYRIEKEEEAYDFGYEDYFFSGKYCFVEWPERVSDLLPNDCLDVRLIVNEDDSRTVSWDEKQ
jgi:tRNA threonylcarbamoyladenosine biosynthesis protein TsaE